MMHFNDSWLIFVKGNHGWIEFNNSMFLCAALSFACNVGNLCFSCADGCHFTVFNTGEREFFLPA